MDLTRRSQTVAPAIRSHTVIAFAPELLRCELMSAAHRKLSPRSGLFEADVNDANRQIADFLALRLTYVPGVRLAEAAWELPPPADAPLPIGYDLPDQNWRTRHPWNSIFSVSITSTAAW
jgi:hypothetical protein